MAASGTLDRSAEAQPAPIPILDSHIHLFDPRRPQGAPYTGPRVPGQPPIPALPDRYRKLAVPHGIVGAIKVECSPWIEDNLWVLQIAEQDTIMVGVIGNLQPEKPEFAEYLGRYHKNRLFRGIRYGNLWRRDLTAQVENPDFIRGIQLLAEADLVLETADPTVRLLEGSLRLTDKVPGLRLILDHLPRLVPHPDEQAAYRNVVRELGMRPQVYVKLSEIIHRVDDRIPTDLASYREQLDFLMETFGEDRILFGSDWPHSDGFAPFEKVMSIAKEYFSSQPRRVAEKYFWRNSIAAYKWTRRDPAQPS